jgi:hypothetical protein
MINAHEIVTALSQTRTPRATLYLNERVIGDYFAQRVSAIQELSTSEKLQPEVSANLAVLGFKLGGGRETSASVALDPVLKAILVEYEAALSAQLVDLGVNEGRPGFMLRHIGASHIVDIDEAVAPANSGFAEPLAVEVERERLRQQKRLQARDPGRKTIVWVAETPVGPIASIASDEWVKSTMLISYSHPPFGILGRFENRIGEVVFVAPFWIWHEGW